VVDIGFGPASARLHASVASEGEANSLISLVDRNRRTLTDSLRENGCRRGAQGSEKAQHLPDRRMQRIESWKQLWGLCSEFADVLLRFISDNQELKSIGCDVR
jgi:hypothetical protein